MRYLILVLSCITLFSCKSVHEIIDWSIDFDEKREQLTLEYLSSRYDLVQANSQITPKMIVLHWTAIPTLRKSFEAFEKSTLPNWRPELVNRSGLNVSAHFLVDQDGTIYRLMPETTMARHVIGLNHCAIGIENVGGTKDTPLTDAQLKSNIWLVTYLAGKYDIEYLIGHYEYSNFENHPFWLEKDGDYRTQKTDPGTEFLSKVKIATDHLNFKATPSR